MTDHESDQIKTLFQSADLEHVPTSRDLIGPALAWGSGRRRRDRWTAAGAAGAVAAVAVAGVVALRPGGGSGPQSVSPGRVGTTQNSAKPPALPKLTGTIAQREQQLLSLLTPYLPAGYHIACQDLDGSAAYGDCAMMTFASPTGTSIGQWNQSDVFYMDGPADAKYDHEHTATAAIPLVSGTIEVPGGTVRIQSTDSEAQVNVYDKAALTDPQALVFNVTQYVFTPTGATDPAKSVTISLLQMIREMPWKPGATGVPNAHAMWGFNTTGPVLSPQQFATLASAPIFAAVLRELAALNQQARQPPSAPATSAPTTSTP